MGVVMIAVSFIGVGGQYFPMWGGMFFPARKGVTEEDYYFAEYNAAEKEKGYHLASSAFVSPQSRAFQFCLLMLPLHCAACHVFCAAVTHSHAGCIWLLL